MTKRKYEKLLVKIILFFLQCSLVYNNSLVFPFNTISTNLTNRENKIEQDILDMLINDLYMNLEIGSPPQKIDIRLSVHESQFYISKPDTSFEPIYPKKNGSFYFNKSLSSTFGYQSNKEKETYFSHPHLSDYVQDNFLFHPNDDINRNIIVENFSFFLANKINGPFHGLVGMLIGPRKMDFLFLLKQFKVINNNIWYLNYSNISSGMLYIGDYPHDIFNNDKNNVYKENTFRKVYSSINEHYTLFKWELVFNKLYTKTKLTNNNTEFVELFPECEKCRNVELNPNIGVIIGSAKFNTHLKNAIFNKYIKQEKCVLNYSNIYKHFDNEEYYYYYCNVSIVDKLKEEFQPIIFEHNIFVKNFTLTYEDLFEIKDELLFFKMIFTPYDSNYWVFGAPFMSKYLFTFNSDSKEIGYYSDQTVIIESKDSIDFSIIKKFIKVLFWIILVIIGIIIGKKIFRVSRKIRANELEEQFEYKTEISSNEKQQKK